MGAVYKARDTSDRSICAIKEMSLSNVPKEERAQAIENFKVEATILWGLNHPNLPKFTGFFKENQRYFLVMEYIDGYTLEYLLERNRGPFPERQVLGWARQLCDVLEYLHSQSPPIIFRDIKPGNIMLTRDGRIKLIDFGIARFFRATVSRDTQLLGTPGYASPEQYGPAQTDERSDIYSLAITLFELLSDTLSEQGFGLKDIREINPRVSPNVAHALEKAAAIDADQRYNNVAEFRRALLGEGIFFFENDDRAANAAELADLCVRYPEEAAKYLLTGEIELWLQEIGEQALARQAQQIRMRTDDPQEAIDLFLRAAIGPTHPLRARPTPINTSWGLGRLISPHVPAQQSVANSAQGARTGGFLLRARKAAAPVEVSQRMLDFGEVHPGISAPLEIIITCNHGLLVHGTIRTSDPWIMVDQKEFEDVYTYVNVRINANALQIGKHYIGKVVISPDDARDITVIVEADIRPHTPQSAWRRRGGKTIGADLDDDESDALTMGNVAPVSPVSSSQQIYHPAYVDPDDVTEAQTTQQVMAPQQMADTTQTSWEKYGQPGDTDSVGWDPLPASMQQRQWRQRGFVLFAALMLGSLYYTLVTALLHVPIGAIDPSNSWFILILAGMVPATTLGAMFTSRDASWTAADTLNRLCTGMGAALLIQVLFKITWLAMFHNNLPWLQLILLLLITSLGAMLGTNAQISDTIIYRISWALTYARWPVLVVAVLVGIVLGAGLTLGIAINVLTLVAVLIGASIIVGLVRRVDYLMKHNQP